MKKIFLNMIRAALATCGICHGSGLVNVDTDPKECPSCKGKGFK